MMILVFSASSNQSPHVAREMERAVSKGIPILPLRIADAEPSAEMEYYLAGQHWLDAFPPPLEPHLAKLTETVWQVLRTLKPAEKAPPAADAALESPDRRPEARLDLVSSAPAEAAPEAAYHLPPSALETLKICPKCQTANTEEDLFCKECGTSLDGKESMEIPAPYPQAGTPDTCNMGKDLHTPMPSVPWYQSLAFNIVFAIFLLPCCPPAVLAPILLYQANPRDPGLSKKVFAVVLIFIATAEIILLLTTLMLGWTPPN